MMNPEDDIYIDEKTSFTREEIVAKLMGWLQGTRRRAFTEITSNGIAPDQLPNIHSFDGLSVMQLLHDQRDSAQREFFASANSNDTVETIQAKELLVIQCDALIDKAKSYFIDFDEDVANEAGSSLKIDKTATESTGISHYRIKSIDAWAMDLYGISIIDTEIGKSLAGEESEYPVDVRNEKEGLSKTSANSLFVTMAILIEAFVEKCGTEFGDPSDPTVSTLSQYLSDHAKPAGKRTPLRGQSDERIMDRIEEAIRIKSRAFGPPIR
jgi:hypothetical protein